MVANRGEGGAFRELGTRAINETVLSDTPAVLATSRMPTMVLLPCEYWTGSLLTSVLEPVYYSADLVVRVTIPASSTMTMADGKSR